MLKQTLSVHLNMHLKADYAFSIRQPVPMNLNTHVKAHYIHLNIHVKADYLYLLKYARKGRLCLFI